MVGSQRGGGLRDVPDLEVVHLLDWGVQNVVGPHLVLESEGRLRYELLRDGLLGDACRRKTRVQVSKGVWRIHHQTLHPHPLDH